jgi:hypothetical protein
MDFSHHNHFLLNFLRAWRSPISHPIKAAGIHKMAERMEMMIVLAIVITPQNNGFKDSLMIYFVAPYQKC